MLVNLSTFEYIIYVTGGPTRNRSAAGMAMDMFEQHQGTHILQVRTPAVCRLFATSSFRPTNLCGVSFFLELTSAPFGVQRMATAA